MVPDCLPRRVLLIDDVPMLRRTLGALLRHAGHAVAEAADGRAGVAIFRETPVDIVLTDFAMPGFTGWEVAQAAKAINPHVPVVYVTGVAAHEIAPHQRAAVEAIIGKPCGLATLQTVIPRLTGTTGAMPRSGPEDLKAAKKTTQAHAEATEPKMEADEISSLGASAHVGANQGAS